MTLTIDRVIARGSQSLHEVSSLIHSAGPEGLLSPRKLEGSLYWCDRIMDGSAAAGVIKGYGVPMGFWLAETEPVDGLVNLKGLYVTPRARRHGLGTRLLADVRAYFSDNDPGLEAHSLRARFRPKADAIAICEHQGLDMVVDGHYNVVDVPLH